MATLRKLPCTAGRTLDQLGFCSGFHCPTTQLLPSPTRKFCSFPARQTGREAGWPLLSVVLRCERGSTAMHTDSASLQLTKLNNSKKQSEKAAHIGRAFAVGLLALFSCFFWRQWVLLLLFRLPCRPRGFLSLSPVLSIRRGCRGSGVRRADESSQVCSAAATEFNFHLVQNSFKEFSWDFFLDERVNLDVCCLTSVYFGISQLSLWYWLW